jgi:hypothetical protein
VDEWISVLKLSTMWDFLEMRELAINELSLWPIDWITKIVLARQYKISQWLFAAYEGLAKRKEPISVAEAQQLGLTTVIRIVQIREESAAKRYPREVQHTLTINNDDEPYTYTIQDSGLFDRKDCECAEGIRSAFAEELREVEQN